MPYWKPIKKSNLSTKKENDSDIKIDRVTEIISAHPKEGCERMAWSAKNEKSYIRQTMTLAGTVAHWKIEKYLAEKYDLSPPPTLEEDLDEEDFKLYKEEIAKEDIVVNGRKVTRQRILPKINHVYNNFIDFMSDPNSFWNRYDVHPLYLEKKVWSEDEEYGGTIDCLAIATIGGVKQIVLIDWKSGQKELKIHEWQLAAYYHALLEMVEKGRIQLPSLPISNKAWCVKFGGHKYDATLINVSLASHMKEFFRAKKVFETVTDTPKGWNILCMFCGYSNECHR